MRRLSGVLLLIVMSCRGGSAPPPSTFKATPAKTQQREISVRVTTPYLLDGRPPQPVVIRIRSRAGVVLAASELTDQAEATIRINFSSDDPPQQIEAVVDDRASGYPIGAYAGSVLSMRDQVSRYCVVLPAGCVL